MNRSKQIFSNASLDGMGTSKPRPSCKCHSLVLGHHCRCVRTSLRHLPLPSSDPRSVGRGHCNIPIETEDRLVAERKTWRHIYMFIGYVGDGVWTIGLHAGRGHGGPSVLVPSNISDDLLKSTATREASPRQNTSSFQSHAE